MMRALKPLLIASLAAFAAFAAWGAAAVSAAAFPDAQVDAELKPNFRALIYPPIHRHERYRYVRPSSLYRPAHPELYPYAAPAAALDLTVDCADPRRGGLHRQPLHRQAGGDRRGSRQRLPGRRPAPAPHRGAGRGALHFGRAG